MYQISHRFLVMLLVTAMIATPAIAGSVPFRTNFNLDVVGLPPGLGGPSQPSSATVPTGATITVVDQALGLSDQPAELYSADGTATYLRWNLLPWVTDLGVEVAFRVSFDQARSSFFFQLSGGPLGTIPLRLWTTPAGVIRAATGCGSIDVGAYTPGMPVNLVVRFAPPDAIWLVVDGENDGFEDNEPLETTSCNPIDDLRGIWVFANQVGSTSPATVILDDLEVSWLPIFVDGFELGDTSLWSATVP